VAANGSADVFLSYNHKDGAAVEALAQRLTSAGITPWFDRWSIQPGEPWQKRVEDGIRAARTILVIVGPSGRSGWQDLEMMAAVEGAVKDGHTVIPVLLPGVSDEAAAALPAFLRAYAWADLRREPAAETAWLQLVAALRNDAAHQPSSTPTTPAHPLDDVPVSLYLERLGLSPDSRSVIEKWARAEILRLKSTRPERDRRSITDLLADVGESDDTRERVREFLECVLGCFAPARVLRRCFYLSRAKVTQTYRAYRNVLPAAAEASTAEQFLALHEHFRIGGRLVFSPGETLLGRPLTADRDALVFFAGTFELEVDETTKRLGLVRLPDTGEISENDAAAAVTALFTNVDPAVYPLARLVGTVANQSVSASLSRKYFRINSGSYVAFGDWLRSRALPIEGFATVQRDAAGRFVLQPMVCDFSETAHRYW
jgi:hypothetical protein